MKYLMMTISLAEIVRVNYGNLNTVTVAHHFPIKATIGVVLKPSTVKLNVPLS